VTGIVGDLQEELNTVFNLDDALANGDPGEGPVRITVDDPERNGRGRAGDD
jgi:hypothetical protein